MLGPIFGREWVTLPRRGRHYANRAAYLGLLWVLAVAAWQALFGWGRDATLGQTARFGQLLFEVWATVQLTLLLFLAALAAAAAVAREKDRGTFPLLLLTDLRDHEIVLGKAGGSLLPIAVLWLASWPLWLIALLLGGVGPGQVLQLGLLLAATAWAAAALGGLIALWRDQTFQVLALTVLALVLYVCLVRALGLLPAWADWPLVEAYLEPYRALESVLRAAGRPAGVAPPVYGYAAVMAGLGGLLHLWGVARLRAWSRRGEAGGRRQAADDEDKDRAHAHAAPGTARPVWANPIFWREVRTRAYGRRPLLVKAAYFLVLGLVCAFALGAADGRTPFAAAYGLVPVTVLSLLLVSAQAVTAITSERDSRALDLLLATDITPREFIFGKLGGVCWNTKEYLLPPLLLAGVYATLGQLATPARNHPELLTIKNFEALIGVAGGLLAVEAFVVAFGVHVALRTANSQEAVFQTLGTVFLLSVGTLACVYLIVVSNRFEYQWGTFVLFAAAGVGGLWWVLNGERPSAALKLASFVVPAAVLYTVMTVLIGKPGSAASTDPLLPVLFVVVAFGFAIIAMLVQPLSEFDVALGRTTGGE